MESRDFVYLQEAYQEIYQLDEEVEIATEYFYEMGLNEYGVNALIEELGVEEFVDWVYDIAESYTLTEARARGSRIEPVTKKGTPVGSLRGGAKTAAINRLRREKEARREAEGRASAERPSDMEDALRSQAMKAAKREQHKARKEVPSEPKKEVPAQTKKGIASAIDWAKKKAQTDIEHTRKGLRTLGQSWEKVSKTPEAKALRVGAKKGARFLERHGRTIGGAAGRAAAQNPAVVATFRAGQRLRSAMQKEDYEFEAWVEGLWEDGYDLSDYTWEGLYEAYIEEANRGERELGLTSKERSRKRNLEYRIGFMRPDQRPEQSVTYPKTKSSRKRVFGDKGYLLNPHDNDQKSARKRHKLIRGQRGEEHIERRGIKTRGEAQESYEAYNIIADYLLDEGYAHDLESADAIIASMSEDWIVDILEKFVSPYEGKPSYNDKWGYSPAMRAFRKSEELQKTEPGSKRQKMQTRRSQQLNRVFQAARRA